MKKLILFFLMLTSASAFAENQSCTGIADGAKLLAQTYINDRETCLGGADYMCTVMQSPGYEMRKQAERWFQKVKKDCRKKIDDDTYQDLVLLITNVRRNITAIQIR